MDQVGTHCILELYDCPRAFLEDPEFVSCAISEASRQGLSTLLKQVSHRFHPHGVTALGLLAESHISIHTWPEHEYAAADVFTCGRTAQPQRACQFLVDKFCASRHRLVTIARGDAHPTVKISTLDEADGAALACPDGGGNDPWQEPKFAPTAG